MEMVEMDPEAMDAMRAVTAELERRARIAERNAVLDMIQARCKSRLGAFLCGMLRHRWLMVHLFDDEPDPPYTHGQSNYAGICLRCGNRDLFMGPLREAMNNCQRQPPRASTVLNALLRGVSEETIIRTINGEKQ